MATIDETFTKIIEALDTKTEGVAVTEWPVSSQNPPCSHSVQIGEYKVDVRPDKLLLWGTNGEELVPEDTKNLSALKSAVESYVAGKAKSALEPEVKVSSMDDLHEKLTEILNKADAVEIKEEIVAEK